MYHKPLDYESSDGLTRYAGLGDETLALNGTMSNDLIGQGMHEDPVLVPVYGGGTPVPYNGEMIRGEDVGDMARILDAAIDY